MPTPKRRNPKFCVTAAAGWRAVFLSQHHQLVTLPVAYFNVYSDGSTEAVVLNGDSFNFELAGQPSPTSTETVPTERALVGYCSPGESTVRFERLYVKKEAVGEPLGVMRG
jgi:hypothetical protein